MITTKITKITKRGSRFFYLKYLRVLDSELRL